MNKPLRVRHKCAVESLLPNLEQGDVLAGVFLQRSHVPDTGMTVDGVIPVYEGSKPCSGMVETGEESWKTDVGFSSPEEGFDKWIVVTDSRPGEGEFDLNLCEERYQCQALHWPAVVGVDELGDYFPVPDYALK